MQRRRGFECAEAARTGPTCNTGALSDASPMLTRGLELNLPGLASDGHAPDLVIGAGQLVWDVSAAMCSSGKRQT